MINFQVIESQEDIFNYIGNLWRSDLFKQSHTSSDGYIHQLVQQFSNTPRIFFDMHKEQLEMVHFSSWFHAIQHRKHYTDPILHDLYYHHELYHLITMTYVNHQDYDLWKQKMKDNEFWASLESEALIYFYLPELRSQSFSFPLWIDQFLDKDEFTPLFGKYGQYEDGHAYDLKMKIAHARDLCETEPISDLDQVISDYTVSSKKWAEIWQNDWHHVENHMHNYLQQLSIDKKNALKYHMNWLQKHIDNDPDKVAFGQQAHAYSEVHQSLFRSAYNPVN